MEQRPVAFRDNETWWLGTDGGPQVYVEYLCEDYSTEECEDIRVSARIRVPIELKKVYMKEDNINIDRCGDTLWIELVTEGNDTIQEAFDLIYPRVQEQVFTMAGKLNT